PAIATGPIRATMPVRLDPVGSCPLTRARQLAWVWPPLVEWHSTADNPADSVDVVVAPCLPWSKPQNAVPRDSTSHSVARPPTAPEIPNKDELKNRTGSFALTIHFAIMAGYSHAVILRITPFRVQPQLSPTWPRTTEYNCNVIS